MVRRLILMALLGAALLTPGGTAPAQSGCTLPANPGGSVQFGLVPAEVDLGEAIGWNVAFNSDAEADYAIDMTYEVDGPDGHHTYTVGDLPVKATTAGSYTVTAHWTETCDSSVPGGTAVTAKPGSFLVHGPEAPRASLEIHRGGRRLPDGRRAGAVAIMSITCPTLMIDEPYRAWVRMAGHTVAATSRHGCLSRNASSGRGRATAFYELAAAGELASVTAYAPKRLRGHLELLSGGRLVGAYDVRFFPVKGRERVKLVRARCPGDPAGCRVVGS
jgi:hypothetical protein